MSMAEEREQNSVREREERIMIEMVPKSHKGTSE